MSLDDAYRWLDWAALAVIVGVVLEGVPSIFKFAREAISRNGWRSAFSKSLHHWDELVSLVGAIVVAFALMAELHFSSVAQTESLEKLKETQRVQGVLISELEPRGFTKEQFESFVSRLRGHVKEIAVYIIPDPEAYSFGMEMAVAFEKAGASVRLVFLKSNLVEVPGIGLSGETIYVAPDDPAKKVLVDAFVHGCPIGRAIQCGAYMPDKPLEGIPSPSLFVALHPVPLAWAPEWKGMPPSMPKPPWELKR